MKKKRVFACFLACVLLLLCACSPQGQQPSPTPGETVSPEPAASPEPVATPDPAATENPEPEPSPDPTVIETPKPEGPIKMDFPLPVYPHTMEAGEADYYAVLDDGRLVMFGESYYIENTQGDEPMTLLENAAAVYEYHSSVSGDAVAIDRDGTLWGLYGSICWMNPDYSRETSEGPVRLMDDVAMVDVTRAYAYILKRDGTLWHWGAQEGFPGFYDYHWADPEDPGKPVDEKNTLTKIMDNVIRMGANNSGSGGGWAVTADGVLWEWYSSPEIRKVTDQATWEDLERMQFLGKIGRVEIPEATERLFHDLSPVSRIDHNYILQQTGTLWYFHASQDALLNYLEDVEQIAASDSGGILFRKTDGSYWLREQYNEDGSERNPYKFDPVKVLDPVQ